uniref:hypothetical protein n=1 Tax=Gonatophragmium mori TaxID=2966219 RepID=UPI0023D8A6EC|nr:hypothetical protein P2Z26_mgp12 [Gonatophragmium mori]WCZ71168.1 hypothetical protein [Gonatophragmium mori]
MSLRKQGVNNPMFGKEKSKEFLHNMHKNKKGVNNPMYGKKKSEETLSKLRKEIYVYNNEKNLINTFDSVSSAVKSLKISAGTIKKYKDTNKIYKDLYFYSNKI